MSLELRCTYEEFIEAALFLEAIHPEVIWDWLVYYDGEDIDYDPDRMQSVVATFDYWNVKFNCSLSLHEWKVLLNQVLSTGVPKPAVLRKQCRCLVITDTSGTRPFYTIIRPYDNQWLVLTSQSLPFSELVELDDSALLSEAVCMDNIL